MNAFFIIFVVLLLVYAATLLVLAVGFKKLRPYASDVDPVTPVSIIVPARNEQQHLARCLRSILEQDYPRPFIQVIVVNDASTDSTALIADTTLEDAGIDYRVLTSPMRKGKKNSISTAIKFARHEFIVLRDADTFTTSARWLHDICTTYQQRPGLIIGPVAVTPGNSLLGAIQALETATLALVTGGSVYHKRPFLCSGANLAFSKELFRRTGGYQSHSHLVSGDDVFFLEDVKKLGDVPISYVKTGSALVSTYPLKRLWDVLMQKSRWASKFRYNSNVLNLWLAFFVFATNAAFIIALAGLFLKPGARTFCSLYISGKLSTDFFLLSVASTFIKTRVPPKYVIPAAFLYPFYACTVALLSMFIKPVWKEE